jgi:hypothetical protein
MHNDLQPLATTSVTTPARVRSRTMRAIIVVAATAALAACDDAPVEPRTRVPADGPQRPSAVINIFPPGQLFPAPIAFVTGSPVGSAAQVQAYDKAGKLMAQFYAFTQAQDFSAGVEVALADMNNDGYPDIIAGEGPTPGAPNPSMYAVWNGRTGAMMASGAPYWNSYRGGVRVGAGDFDGDGIKEVLACLGPGGSNVGGYATGAYVYKLGKSYPYITHGTQLGDPITKFWMTGGCRVAGGDIDGDGRDEMIATFHGSVNSLLITKGGVKVTQAWHSPLGTQYKGELSVAAGDVTGDQKAEVMVAEVAAVNGQPPVAVFDGSKISVTSLLPTPTVVKPFNLWWAAGLTIAARDFDGDGVAELFAKPTSVLGGSGLSIFKGPTFTSYILSIMETAVKGNGGPIG